MKYIIALAALAAAAPAQQDANAAAATEQYANVRDALKSMPGADEGYVDVGSDGVARAILQNGTIVSALRLSTEQLTALATTSNNEVMLSDLTSGLDVPDSRLFVRPANDPVSDDSDADITENPADKAKKDLEGRQLYCLWRKCSTGRACAYMHCSLCAQINYDRGYKVCYP